MNEKLYKPNAPELQYMGRIDFLDATKPILVYPYSQIRFRYSGHNLKMKLLNQHSYWDSYLGLIIDGAQTKIRIDVHEKEIVLVLAQNLSEGIHDVTIFKRMDSCHQFTFLGLIGDADSKLYAPDSALPHRKIEIYGDSVSAGEVSEAVDYVNQEDPEHNGEYSNSWYSYGAIAARALNAQLHSIAQGGIPLMTGTGWFCDPDFIGIEDTWDKIEYHPEFGESVYWDFSNYTPHVVIVAIGQNDSNPYDFMKDDYRGAHADQWRRHYKTWIRQIREKHPDALIVLTTTILNHDEAWDDAIEEVRLELANELQDEKIVHFLYTDNGAGTPGHIRIPEARQMADELVTYLNSFGEAIWQ
ncbi:MAG: GDSL-type esterase/lipase family protein [Clostridiales Family XIII bacterium]|nr:GDSL-type esterase/lipase family protein [Clostridiales Family XIII bacterium]